MRRTATMGAVLAMAATVGVGPTCAEIEPGQTLGRDTWQQAEGLLPPEILKHYREGEYENPVVAWPDGKFNWPPDFLAASKQNEGRYAIGELGQVIDPATGKLPDYVLGHPFPTIDPSDPQAATKILWNFYYRTWYFGNVRAESQVNWVSPKGLDRRSDQVASFMYYDGIPEDERQPNPQNFNSQTLFFVTAPADLHSTAALTWRYRDPDKRDSTWSYVPALRRVRAVSPANRSDGFLGSDYSQDDGPFFDGKVEDFTWTVAGEQDSLRIADPYNLEGKHQSIYLGAGKGWRANWPDIPFIGYMDPDWKGIGWAPRTAVLAKRRFWIIEGVPRDKYYLFGKIELWIDKLTFQGSWNRKFSWKGELLNTMQVMAWNPLEDTRPDGQPKYGQGSSMAFQCSENVKLNRATIAGVKWTPTASFDGRLTFDPRTFDVDALARVGK